MNTIKELNEQMEEILSEEIIRQGKTIDGNPWTDDKIGEKEVEILGITLKYNIFKHHVDMPEQDKNYLDQDKVKYILVNTEACAAIEQAIKDLVYNTLVSDSSATQVTEGGTRSIGIPLQGELL